MWVSDGSELLTWKGDLNESFEWARYIGFCNTNYHAYTGNEFSPERVAKFYVPDPPVMTYGLLKTIVQLFKQIAKEELDLELSVGATFDPDLSLPIRNSNTRITLKSSWTDTTAPLARP